MLVRLAMDASTMNHAIMPEYLLLVTEASGWFVAGTLLGLLHFVSLQWNVRCLIGGQALASFGLHLLRFALTGGALALVTRWYGALPLLAGTLGLMVARTALLLAEPQ